MNIYLVHEEAFPVGMAATNRILALSKGFVENQARVKIICMRSAERPDRGIVNKEWKGVVNGAEYEYASGTPIRANTFLKNRSLLWNLNLEIYFRYLHTMLDAVLVMSENLESILRSRGRKKLRIIRVPMTVETTRFLEKTGPSPDH